MEKKILKKLGAAMISSAMLISVCSCGSTGNSGASGGENSNGGNSSSSNGAGGSQQETPVYATQSGLTAIVGETVNLSDYVTADQPELSEMQPDEIQIAGISDSSLCLLSANMKENPGKNVLISPTSILFAFGMAENGAAGETLSEMEQVVNGGIGIDELNPLMYSMNQKLSSADEVSWSVADSIWVRNSEKRELPLQEQFVKDAVTYYDADIIMAPFDETTLEDINAWVNENTHGMIPTLLDEIPSEAIMYLINAMAFEGEWQEQYEDTQIMEGREFNNADGGHSTVTMLSSEETRYMELGGGIGFQKDYKGGEYSFIGILPPEDMSLTEYVEMLVGDYADSGADLAASVRNAKSDMPVYVTMPEFKADYGIEMKELLLNMGMEKPFGMEADFSKMFTDSSAYIGAVYHKTHIEVDRKGTKAAAVTAIEMDEAAAEGVYIYMNRPFLYGIVDNETGSPIFLGCVNEL